MNLHSFHSNHDRFWCIHPIQSHAFDISPKRRHNATGDETTPDNTRQCDDRISYLAFPHMSMRIWTVTNLKAPSTEVDLAVGACERKARGEVLERCAARWTQIYQTVRLFHLKYL
eukprot:1344995-Amorphochlora_amoeboformis.AAC.1